MDFIDWLAAQQREHQWNISQMARFIGVSHPLVSDVLNRNARVTERFVVLTAKAFDESLTHLMALAGYWDASPAEIQNEELAAILRDLEAYPAQYQAALSMLRGLHREIKNHVTPESRDVSKCHTAEARQNDHHALATMLSGLPIEKVALVPAVIEKVLAEEERRRGKGGSDY